ARARLAAGRRPAPGLPHRVLLGRAESAAAGGLPPGAPALDRGRLARAVAGRSGVAAERVPGRRSPARVRALAGAADAPGALPNRHGFLRVRLELPSHAAGRLVAADRAAGGLRAVRGGCAWPRGAARPPAALSRLHRLATEAGPHPGRGVLARRAG